MRKTLVKLFPRLMRSPVAPSISAYSRPPEPSGGAEEYVPAMVLRYPATWWAGDGIPVCCMPMIDSGPQLRTVKTVFQVGASGNGIAAQQLINDNIMADAYPAPAGTWNQEYA